MQQLFVRHYLSNGFSATEASVSLGARSREYAKRSGYKLLHMPAVAAEINRIMKEALDSAGLTDDYISNVLKIAVDACVNGAANKEGLVMPREAFLGVELVQKLKNADKNVDKLLDSNNAEELVNRFRSEY